MKQQLDFHTQAERVEERIQKGQKATAAVLDELSVLQTLTADRLQRYVQLREFHCARRIQNWWRRCRSARITRAFEIIEAHRTAQTIESMFFSRIDDIVHRLDSLKERIQSRRRLVHS